MTSTIIWAGVDSRAPASLYFATDSRISWDDGATWSAARKVFVCRLHPDMFCFVGDTLFPAVALPQVVDLIDHDLLATGATWEQRRDAVTNVLNEMLSSFPRRHRHAVRIYHAWRDGIRSTKFHLSRLDEASGGLVPQDLAIPDRSGVIDVDGSGGPGVQVWLRRWASSHEGGTSRSLFSAFCDALYAPTGVDPRSGPPPQLAALYCKGAGRLVGVSIDGVPFLGGAPCQSTGDAAVEWRNRHFERVTARGKLLDGAQAHAVPRGLGGKATDSGGRRR